MARRKDDLPEFTSRTETVEEIKRLLDDADAGILYMVYCLLSTYASE